MWTQLLWSLVFTVLAELLRPKPKGPKPAALDDINFPTAEESRPIPVVFGTCKVAGPNVTWYGDLRTKAIKKSSGLFGSKTTVGYKYFIGFEACLCHGPVDEVVDILADDNTTNIPYTETNLTVNTASGATFNFKIVNGRTRSDATDVSSFTFYLDKFFGGEEREGGLKGIMRVYKGTQTQTANTYLQTKRGKSLPAYTGFCYAVSEQMYVGTSAYVKPFAFVLKRQPNGLGLTSNKHKIGDDANPACMIYEILTNSTWGCGLSSALIDVAGLRTVGETLYTEGFGLSMLCNGGTSGRELIDEILRHIDGVIYADPQTGLISVKLARADYVRASLPIYGPDEISSINFSRASWSETKNTVKVTFIDRSLNYTERTVQAQDLANVQARNGTIDAEDTSYLAISNSTQASKAANRLLKTLSYPGAKYNLRLNRKAWALRLGSVFRLTWPNDGIDDVVLRVIRIDYGDASSQAIEVDAVEDIFAIEYNAYPAPPTNGWVNPISAPLAVANQLAFEAPYELSNSANRYGVVVASRSGPIDQGFDIYSTGVNDSTYALTADDVPDFTPTGLLTAEYASSTAALDSTGFVVQTAVDMDQVLLTPDEFTAGRGLALIKSAAGEEWVAWQMIVDNGDGTYTFRPVMRGIYDTVPLTHAAGARVWVLSEGRSLVTDADYTTNGTVKVKLCPYNAYGELPLASAVETTFTLAQRASKPYPAAYLQVNSSQTPTTTTGNAVLTWRIRHRTVQGAAGKVVAQDAADQAAAPEGSYTVKVYIGGVNKRTQTGLTTATYTYTYANRTADDADTTKLVKFGITAVNGSLSSVERFTPEFLMNP